MRRRRPSPARGDTLIVETDGPASGGRRGAVEGVLRLGDGNGLSV